MAAISYSLIASHWFLAIQISSFAGLGDVLLGDAVEQQHMVSLENNLGLVGREKELGFIAEFLNNAEQALVVSGGEGVGKSAFLSELQEHHPAAHLLSVNNSEAQLPYSGLHLILDVLDLTLTVPFESGNSTDPFHAFATTRELLRVLRASNLRPSLLLIDHANLLDVGTKQVLGMLIRRIRGTNLHIILSKDSTAGFEEFDGIPELALEPLNTRSSMELVEELTGRGPDICLMVAQYSGGVPLAIIELCEQLGRSPEWHSNSVMLPPRPGPQTVTSTLKSLRDLDNTAIEQLQLLSCAYQTPVEAFQWLIPDQGTILDELLASGLIRVREGMFSIASPLLRICLYWSMPAHERSDAHHRLAEALRISRDPLMLWHESFTNPTAESIDGLVHTIQQYLERGFLELALEVLERARALAGDDAKLEAIIEETVKHLLACGQVSYAQRYEQVLHRLCGPIASPSLTLLSLKIEFYMHHRINTTRCDALVESYGQSHPQEVARVLIQAIFYHLECHQFQEAQILRSHPLLIAGSLNERHAALCQIIDLSLQPTSKEISLSCMDVIELMKDTSVLGKHRSSLLLARALTHLEEFDHSRKLLDSIIESTQGIRSIVRGLAFLYLAENDYLSGWHRAAANSVEALLGASTDPSLFPQAANRLKIWYWGFTRKPVQFRFTLKEFEMRFQPLNQMTFSAHINAILGRYYLDQNLVLQAHRHLLLAHSQSSSADELTRIRVVPDLIETYLLLNDVDEAQRMFEHFKESQTKSPSRWGSMVLPRCEALVTRGEESLHAFARAEAQWSPQDSKYEHMRLLRAHAHRLNDHGKHEVSTQKRTSIGYYFGSTLVEDRTAKEIANSPKPDPETVLGVLLPHEREVIVLALDGLTNKEIAKQVQLTVRGVEARLKTAYGKLGIKRRTQLKNLREI